MLLLHTTGGPVHGLAFSPDGTMLAAVSLRSSVIELWDPIRGEIASHFRHDQGIGCLAFTPCDPAALAWSDRRGNLLISDLMHDWAARFDPVSLVQDFHSLKDLNSVHNWARQIDEVAAHPHLSPRLVFSPDGRRLAATGISRVGSDLPVFYRPRFGVTLWHWQQDAGFGQPLANRDGDTMAVAFSPDGDALAFGGMDRKARIWDLSNMQQTAVFAHERKLHYLAFCRGGRTLVTGSPDGLIRLWDVERGKHLGTLRGQSKTVTALASSPDGQLIATSSSDGVVRFWDAERGRLRNAYNWNVGAVWSVTFAPDGQRAAAGGTGSIVVWDID